MYISSQKKKLLQIRRACLKRDLLLGELLLKERKLDQQKRTKKRAFWVSPWLLRRPLLGQYEKLMDEL